MVLPPSKKRKTPKALQARCLQGFSFNPSSVSLTAATFPLGGRQDSVILFIWRVYAIFRQTKSLSVSRQAFIILLILFYLITALTTAEYAP
jgi:hypothetical protein